MEFKPKMNLLYRISDDGDKNEKFWEKCENKGHTVTFIKSKKGKIFGGHRVLPFKKTSSYKRDMKCFLMSFTHKKKIKLKDNNNTQYAVYDAADRLPTWGGGHDLGLYNNCTTSNSNYSNLDHTYENPNVGVSKNEVLAGSYNFKVEDLEVW
jgi:hypothetical protein